MAKGKRGRPPKQTESEKATQENEETENTIDTEPCTPLVQQKTNSIDEIMGVVAMEVESRAIEKAINDAALSPEESVKELQQQATIQDKFSDWLTVLKSGSKTPNHGTPVLHMNSVRNKKVPNENPNNCVKIDLEDIHDEIEYWNASIVGFVLGANPPLNVIEGFINRIWKDLKIDKTAMLSHGMFIVRFLSLEDRDKALNTRPFFDRKPLIMKPWTADMDLQKGDVKNIPIWVKIHELDFKYWGDKCLPKIIDQLGMYVKADQATSNREKLQFARVLVEVDIEEELPDSLDFVNEKGILTTIRLEYEWKPVKCANCKMFGHESTVCKNGRKKWIAKKPTNEPIASSNDEQGSVVQRKHTQKQQEDQEGFVTVRSTKPNNTHPKSATPTHNSYEVLNEEECTGERVTSVHVNMQEEDKDGRGEDPPGENG